MTGFQVWAPRARQVAVSIDGRMHTLQAGDGGHHVGELPLEHGTRYAIHLDGGPARPDPRSRAQPDGVHAASEWVDPTRFVWTDRAFHPRPLAGGLVYELHLGTFTPEGTLDAAIARIDHLVELGVTHVELMPVAAFPGQRGWGYDGVGLYATHAAYGGPAALARFVDACHARGLAVLLDVVYNHLGPSGNYLGELGPYFTDRHHTPWGDAINLDGEGSGGVRDFILANARGWLEDFHLDGLRLDAVHALFDASAIHILEELAAMTDALGARLGKRLVLIAESDLNDPRVIRAREAHGHGLHAQWSDDFHHALHVALTGERTGYYADFAGLPDVARALQRGFVHDGGFVPSRGRRHGRPLGDLPGHRLLGYAQTHDQVGNRARGDRLAALAGADKARVALGLLLTSPFTPMLFAGEEWGATTPFLYFTDHDDPGLADAVREGRRREFAAFGWKPEDVPDPQAEASFAASKLRWSDLDAGGHAETLHFVRDLVRLRHDWPELADSDLGRVVCHVEGESLVVERGRLLVALNLGPARRVALPRTARRVLLASRPGAELGDGAVQLPSDAFLVLA